MNEIKLIGVDLDGTVLNKDKIISHENIDVFKKCRDNSIYVVPVTGRPFSGLYKEYIKQIGCKYSINTNGAAVMDLASNKRILSHTINFETALKIVNILKEYNCRYSIFYNGYGYCSADFYKNEIEETAGTPLRRYVETTRRVVEDQLEFLRQAGCCDNIYVIANDVKTRDNIFNALKAIDNIFYTSSMGRDVEIGGNCSKGRTLLEFASRLSIKPEQIMAIGDGANDLEMIEMAGISVAMENATDEIKNAADFVTKSCEESGVAYAINKYCNFKGKRGAI